MFWKIKKIVKLYSNQQQRMYACNALHGGKPRDEFDIIDSRFYKQDAHGPYRSPELYWPIFKDFPF
jgi:hypothetical protein